MEEASGLYPPCLRYISGGIMGNALGPAVPNLGGGVH